MKKLLIIMVILIIGIGGYFLLKDNQVAPGNSGEEGTNQEDTVRIRDFSFQPSSLIVKRGEAVFWVNEDNTEHNIISSLFQSPHLKKGEKFEFQFNQTGTFDYSCGIHPQMEAEIIVQE